MVHVPEETVDCDKIRKSNCLVTGPGCLGSAAGAAAAAAAATGSHFADTGSSLNFQDKRNRNPNWTDHEIVRFLEMLQEDETVKDLVANRNKKVHVLSYFLSTSVIWKRLIDAG